VIRRHSGREATGGDAVETFIRREDAERFIEDVRTETIPSSRRAYGSRSVS